LTNCPGLLRERAIPGRLFGLCARNSVDGGRFSESSIVVRIVTFKPWLKGPSVRSRFRAKFQMAYPGIVATIDSKSSYQFRQIEDCRGSVNSGCEKNFSKATSSCKLLNFTLF
jgi:hypothetical protein